VRDLVAKKDREITELLIRVAELEAMNKILTRTQNQSQHCIEEIAKQPRSQKNNITNKVTVLTALDLSAERIKNIVENNFTKTHMLDGQKGVARFAVDHLLRDDDGKLSYICTDPSRHTYRFREGQHEVKDVKSKRLTIALAPPVNDKSHRLAMQGVEDCPEQVFVLHESFKDIKGMEEDNSDFRAELAVMTV
jgi:hypothetical protein